MQKFLFLIFFLSALTMGAQNNTYFGPAAPQEGLVMVQVSVRDGAQAGGQIKEASFAGHEIPLKPRDIYGNRGTGSFQLSPGKYELKWTVQVRPMAWPRTQTHKMQVEISPQDLWVQIEIVGEQAEIL